MVKLVKSARPSPVQQKHSKAEPFNQMTAMQRQELDAFITSKFETKGTLYLSELTGQAIPVVRRISLLINTI